MAKVGYIYQAEEDETFNKAVEWMNEYGCMRVMVEKTEDEKMRPQWKQLLTLLNRGDELVIAKFSNAVRTTKELSALIELCRVQVVRIISIYDEIDSLGKMFPQTSAASVLSMVGSLPEEALALRQRSMHIEQIKKAAVARTAKVVSKTNREQTIVNMYHQNHTIDDIWKASGFSSRSSVFRILNKHGVKLNRGKFSGPIGPRKKKE